MLLQATRVYSSDQDDWDEAIKIDALDIKKCGQMSASAVRSWHNQRVTAYNCRGLPLPESGVAAAKATGKSDNLSPAERDKRDIRRTGSRKVRARSRLVPAGEPALKGEFPFMVTIKLYGDWDSCEGRICSGILIDKDLVLMAAECLKFYRGCPFTPFRVIGVPESKYADRIFVGVKRFCWLAEDHENYTRYGLALLQLKEPIKYVPGKIGPACIKVNKRHLDRTTCAIASSCIPSATHAYFYGIWKNDYNETSVAVKRSPCPKAGGSKKPSPHEVCYKSRVENYGCGVTVGEPVVALFG